MPIPYQLSTFIRWPLIYKKPSSCLPEGGMSDAYFPLNTGVKSLQSSTLNARMSLTESLNQGVFFNASTAMYRLAMSLFADR